MNIEKKIHELQALVSKYDTESFAGFFAHFIKKRPDAFADIPLNKFDSKLKDFFYLIALNAFSENKGTEKFEHSINEVGMLADKLNEIKKLNYAAKSTDNKKDYVIHEMAFRNHFDNGTLSYIEQDLEKIRIVFGPFEDKIINDFGFDIDLLIELYKEIELISMIRFKQVMDFSHTMEFAEFNQRVFSDEMSFSDSFDLLPENIQEAFLSFQSKTYAHLMFTPQDLYHTFPKEKVDKFLALLSCEPKTSPELRYYSAESPFELTPILKFPNDKYLSLYQKQIPISIYKQLYAHFFHDKAYNDKLRRHREKSLEKKVVEIFKSFFPSRDAFFYEGYFVLDNHEQDLLVIHKGTALIIEIKASKLRAPFRSVDKAIIRLKDDFKESIQYGFEQCKRVEDYFFGIEPFHIKDEKGKVLYKVNPNKIHSVYSIIVTLERFGSLQTDLSLMLEKEDNIDYPWSAYIDDLEIFLLALKQKENNPVSKLFNFLKLRSIMHGRMYAVDELDVCASYLQNLDKFRQHAEENVAFLTFSPYQQGYFDELYWADAFRFKERPLPDDFYKFGI